MLMIIRAIKNLIPRLLRHVIRYCMQHRKEFGRWVRILLGGKPASGQLQVFYGHDHVPTPAEQAYGGMVKFQRMQPMLPNSNRRFNILYMVNNWKPKDWPELVWFAHRKRAKIVCNQDGVAYPGWCKNGWEKKNAYMAQFLHASDYVFYQSEFSKMSADRFLGEPKRGWEILYNAVDTAVFTPSPSDPDIKHLVLLLGGNQYSRYRLEAALRTVAVLTKYRADVRLLVTGKLSWTSDEAEAARIAQQLLYELKITDNVQFLGFYKQQEAPDVLRKAHILLHTKYNDPCPGLVIEAMACGLPVVYSSSGGVPELVGESVGIGVPAELNWERMVPPDPRRMAEAVLQVAERRTEFAEAARQRAVEKFDLQPWLQRHREVFEELLSSQ
jgi:glycosyltransferase involved in cell wall biosynthesis